MEFDPELIKQLIDTFKAELDEKAQIISDGLLLLEKNNLTEKERGNIIERIFRSAHNIKGTARGIGINDVGEIAHYIESIFSAIQQKSVVVTKSLISLCLEGVDNMRIAMQAFVDKAPLPFDLSTFLKRLESGDASSSVTLIMTEGKDVEEVVVKEPVIEVADVELSAEQASPLKKESNRTIHVSLNSLDKVSALMEEMQVNKIAIDDHYHDINKLNERMKRFAHQWEQSILSIKSRFGVDVEETITKLQSASADSLAEMSDITSNLHKNMRSQIDELSILSNSLQEEVRTLRLIPATNLLRTTPRYVRDLAIELGKQVEFEIKGDEVKMDKMVLESLQDPINHLLRNAIDHGIENADVRVANGKFKAGHVSIDIREEGSYININIEDDGAGIDIKKVAKLAVDRNMASKAEIDAMDQQQILEFIFRPGFSTKTSVTKVSGRGFGLDVVKENIENIKGAVEITTVPGKGTVFSLRIPLTLASERGFLIDCNGQSFVIPSSSVERISVISPDEVVEIEASQAILVDNHPIYLIALADVLHLDRHEALPASRLSVIIVKKVGQSVALVVDEIIGEREIVVKPMHPPLVSVPCVAGGTLSGSGKVIVVLDTEDIINMAFHKVKSSRISLKTNNAESIARPHILVVDDSITTRTLEKSVLENKNYQVTTAVDGKEAWDILQKQTFSLLITDAMMPNMDGFTLTKNVKNSERLKELPVIIVTSLGSEDEKLRGAQAGADYYIVKSEFESGELLEIVGQLV